MTTFEQLEVGDKFRLVFESENCLHMRIIEIAGHNAVILAPEHMAGTPERFDSLLPVEKVEDYP